MRNLESVVVKCCYKTSKYEKKSPYYYNAMIADSTHLTSGSPHIETMRFTHTETYKFEKKIWKMYCSVCALEMSIDSLIGPWSFDGVMAIKLALNATIWVETKLLMSNIN